MKENALMLRHFTKHFSEHVYPVYKAKEESFDQDGIHGVLHIGRSIIAAYVLGCKAQELGLQAHIQDILIATAFHDSGRQANGDDFWEKQSSENCANFIDRMELQYGEAITFQSTPFVASHILKSTKNTDTITDGDAGKFSIDFMCVYDSDCLEIMRPCTGRGGINGFIKEKMCLYNYSYEFRRFYDNFISEWWDFVSDTESLKKNFSNPDCLTLLINHVCDFDDDKFSIIKQYLC